MLTIIEPYHNLGYVHGDIKPNNILIGLEKNICAYRNEVTDTEYEKTE